MAKIVASYAARRWGLWRCCLKQRGLGHENTLRVAPRSVFRFSYLYDLRPNYRSERRFFTVRHGNIFRGMGSYNLRGSQWRRYCCQGMVDRWSYRGRRVVTVRPRNVAVWSQDSC